MYRASVRGMTYGKVFPTGVGVYRVSTSPTSALDRFPHRRGGVTAILDTEVGQRAVFPTGVGVYRYRLDGNAIRRSFPHRRGGVPYKARTITVISSFSPQAWGCTGEALAHLASMPVFPTGVGVYRGTLQGTRKSRGFPHRRGGVPQYVRNRSIVYIVFPTGVGVYRSSGSGTGTIYRVFPTGVGVY